MLRYAPVKPKPELAKPVNKERAKGAGRPRKADKLIAVTLRLHPETLAYWQSQGSDWRSRAAEFLAREEKPGET